MIDTQEEASRAAGASTALQLAEDFVLAVAWCPPGKLRMGTGKDESYRSAMEEPRHEVILSKGFWIGCLPITSLQWKTIMEVDLPPGMDMLPARGMSWGRAVDFCERLTARLRAAEVLAEGWQIRLPTEAQWEYACRAGTETPWFFGADPSLLDEYAWYGANSGGDLHPVQTKRPNPWGIYDLYGNVTEWCLDSSHLYTELPQRDPCFLDPDGPVRITRGGSCTDLVSECRSASRIFMNAANPNGEDTGLRIVCVPVEGQAAAREGSGSEARTLWSTPDRTRYFLIPEGRELPPGGLLLVRLTGRRQEVDPAAAAEFEVSRDEAKSWTESELKEVLGDVRGRIQGALDDVRRKWEEKAAAPEGQEVRRSAAETLEGLAAALERAGSAAGEKLRAVAEEMRRDTATEKARDDAAAGNQGGDDDDRS